MRSPLLRPAVAALLVAAAACGTSELPDRIPADFDARRLSVELAGRYAGDSVGPVPPVVIGGGYAARDDGTYVPTRINTLARRIGDGEWEVAFYRPDSATAAGGTGHRRIGAPVRLDGPTPPVAIGPRIDGEGICLRASTPAAPGRRFACAVRGRVVTGAE